MIATWLTLAFLGGICFLLFPEPWFIQNIEVFSWLIVSITSIVFVVHVFRKHRETTLMTIIFLGYFLRIGLLVWDAYFHHVVPLFHSGADTEMFYRIGLEFLADSSAMSGFGNYPGFLYRIFFLFGPQRIVAQYVNVLFAVSAVLIAYKILQKFQISDRTSTLMLATAMFAPHFMMINVILLREAPIAFMVVVSLYLFVIWFKKGNVIALGAAFLSAAGAALFHSGSIAIVAGYALCVVFYDRKKQAFRLKWTSVIYALMLTVLFFTVNYFWGEAIFGHWQFESVDDLAGHLARQPLGGAAYAVHIPTGNSYLDIIVNTPIRTLYFLLSPMPWDWRSPWDVAAFILSSAFFGYFYCTAFKTLRTTKGDSENKNVIIMLLLMSVSSAIIFGWGVSNSGTALRHRDKFFLQHVLMFVFCLEERARAHIPRSLRPAIGGR